MEKPIKPGRVAALACILALLVIVFVVALYKLPVSYTHLTLPTKRIV